MGIEPTRNIEKSNKNLLVAFAIHQHVWLACDESPVSSQQAMDVLDLGDALLDGIEAGHRLLFGYRPRLEGR
jgi:hypothetical protein